MAETAIPAADQFKPFPQAIPFKVIFQSKTFPKCHLHTLYEIFDLNVLLAF